MALVGVTLFFADDLEVGRQAGNAVALLSGLVFATTVVLLRKLARDPAAQFFKIDIFVYPCPVDSIRLGKLAERSGEIGVVQSAVDGLFEFLLHQRVPPNSSTKMMTSRSGPWTPMVSTRSMSAVRLGPVIMER